MKLIKKRPPAPPPKPDETSGQIIVRLLSGWENLVVNPKAMAEAIDQRG